MFINWLVHHLRCKQISSCEVCQDNIWQQKCTLFSHSTCVFNYSKENLRALCTSASGRKYKTDSLTFLLTCQRPLISWARINHEQKLYGHGVDSWILMVNKNLSHSPPWQSELAGISSNQIIGIKMRMHSDKNENAFWLPLPFHFHLDKLKLLLDEEVTFISPNYHPPPTSPTQTYMCACSHIFVLWKTKRHFSTHRL